MPISELDTDQRHAATSTASETAIVAGAGSGKTRLLVARYLTLVSRDDAPLSSIAAITFTNKAANQMKVRIADEARALADRDTARAERWQQVAMNAHRAPISTIHSFCSSILRRFPLEAGVDPSFTIIDQTTNVQIRLQAIDEEIEYLLAGGGPDVGLLLNLFGLGLLKRMLRDMLVMRTKVIAFLDAADHGYVPDETVMQRLYEQHIAGRLDTMIATLEGFHSFRPEGDKLALVYDQVLGSLKAVRAAVEGNAFDIHVLERIAQSVNVRGGSKAKWGEDVLQQVRGGLKEARDLLDAIAAYYRHEHGVTASAAAMLLELFNRIDKRCRRAKQERGVLDHDDLLIETWRLLRTDYTVLGTVSKSFRHLMVDEFQDTDGMQMDIIRMIAGNSSASLFTVGDPKQSIYRFRGADVTVFTEFVQDIESFRKLSMNYRSAPGILAFVNTVFGRIMGDEPHTPYDTIYFPMKAFRQADPVCPAAEIIVAAGDSGEARRRIEASAIVERIRRLTDPGAGNPYSYSDMVVLLRTSTSLAVYEEALLSAGIPFVNRIGGKLAGSPEAYDIGNLLGWLACPDDPVLLTAILVSPFFGFDGDDLMRLRQDAGSPEAMGSFLRECAGDDREHGDRSGGRIGQAAGILSELLDIADRLTVRELLDRAFDETGYTLVMAADPITGDRSLAVIDLIVSAAEQFELGSGSRREFAALLRSGQPFSEETAQVETAGNAVSLMTIHGSKGLEFEVVFLADITGAGSKGGSAVVFDDVLGPGLMIGDNRGGTGNTYARTCAAASEKLKDHAESKRLFYVGCTRAKDLLVISGGPPAKHAGVDSANWMSWLHDVLDIPTDGSMSGMATELFGYRWITERISDMKCVAADSMVPPPGIESVLGTVFGIPVSSPLPRLGPSTVSVSELLNAVYGVEAHAAGLIERYDEEHRTGGKDYGTFVHRVFEQIDFAAPGSWTDVGNELLTGISDVPEDFSRMLASDLARFAHSALYRECARASRMYREEPFVITAGGYLLRGTIDLLRTFDGEGPVITDYKTGALPSPESPLLKRYWRQLAIYASAVYTAVGTMPSRLELYFVSHGERMTIPCTAVLMEETDAFLETVYRHMDAQ